MGLYDKRARRVVAFLVIAALLAAHGIPPASAVAPPAAMSVTDDPDPVKAGGTITFSVNWTDTGSRPVRALVCASNFTTSGWCSDDTLASGGYSYAATFGTSWASRSTGSWDVGTTSYYAFVCDDLGQCSPGLPGSYTVNPNAPPIANSSVATPAQVIPGGYTDFQVSYTNPEDDGEQAIICQTNSVWSGNPPSCPGGVWAGPDYWHPASGVVEASRHAATSDIGTHSYWAFVCDWQGACSNSVTGTFTVRANTAPSAVAVSVANPILAGTHGRMTVSWTDPDTTADDEWTVDVCKTSSWAYYGGCSGGIWGAWLTFNDPLSFDVYVSRTAGTYDYWAWVCDRSASCAGPATGSIIVSANTGYPTIANVTDAPDPVTAGSTLTFSVTWADPNAGDIETVRICSTSSCSGSTLASAYEVTTSPKTLSYTVPTGSIGVKDYWAVVCDAVANCSSGYHGTFTVL